MAPADIALGVTGARKPLHHDQVMTSWSGALLYTLSYSSRSARLTRNTINASVWAATRFKVFEKYRPFV